MKKIFIVLYMIAIVMSAYASDTPLFDNFVSVNSFSSDFEQVNKYQGLDEFSISGTVNIVKAEAALWDYEEPAEYYLLRPEGIEHYSEELNQLTRMHIDPKSIDDPNSLLLAVFLDSSDIKNKFNVNEKDSVVTLKPKSVKDLGEIVLTFDGDILKSVFTEDNAGNTITIKFKNMKYNKKIKSSVFNKKIPSGVNIVE